MELIRGLHQLRDPGAGCALTIGNFDGVHCGHQALIARTVQLARQHGVMPALLTFEPTPREFFAPDDRPGRISSLRAKLQLLEGFGIQRLIIQRFDRPFSCVQADAFVEDLLVRRLGVKAVVVGDDFRYGAKRAGDFAQLQAMGRRHGFEVQGVPSVMVAGRRCSSTAVRAALAQSDLALAAQLLGRPYSITGRVRRGLQLGRQLNMPTANLNLFRRPALRLGIYAVRVRDGDRRWDGVASLGVRPTLGLTRCLLETHLFGEPGNLYGRELEIEFVRYQRAELKFDSLDALAEQMQVDKLEAMDLLGSKPA